jgi:hypothetical protein
MKTLGVTLWDGQARGQVPNAPTLMRPAVRRSANVRELFISAYPRFAAKCRAFDEPGIAIIAVDEQTGRPAGIARLTARVARPVAAVVGRHDQCDLYLDGSERLALRQLAVVLSPVKSWEAGKPQVAYRVFDLRTNDGMTDEEGKQLRAMRAEGPSVLRVAGYTLFILVLGDPTDWPESAHDAWSILPERVYFDELDAVPAHSLPRLRIRTAGPRDTGMGLGGNDLAGTLEITGPSRTLRLRIGADALVDGVLLGRYSRCDGTAALDDPSLSRVHAMLLHVDNQLVMIDTSSSNGMRIVGEEKTRLIVIERETEMKIGKATLLRWSWSS